MSRARVRVRISIKARVVAHEVVAYPTRVHLGVLYICPACTEVFHAMAWHAPVGEAMLIDTPCTGDELVVTWEDMPDDVAAVLRERATR